MTLEIEPPQGLSSSEEQEIHKQWDTTEDTLASLWKEGFTPPPQPRSAQPVVTPDDLANSTSTQYSSWFMSFVSWQAYMAFRLNWIAAKKLGVDNELKILGASIRKKMRKKAEGGKKPSEDVINDEVLTTPRCIELTHLQQQLKEQELLLEPQYEYVKSAIRLLSRHLEVRKFEAELSGRGGRSYGSNGGGG